MSNYNQEIDLLFEVSWEVCNKIGGIYTVLSSKAKTLKTQFKDNLIFIGPDVWSAANPSPYFIDSKTLLRKSVDTSKLPEGVGIRIGRWDIPGKPIAILVKFDGMYTSKDEAYGKMWARYGVDSLHAYGDYDEGCAFARAAAIVIENIVTTTNTDRRKVTAHFNEWTTAMGLLSLKSDMPEVATVFTTHATCIGRSICGNGKPLYDQLPNYNGNQMAQELNMEAKHSLEKAAAHNADCFTTVSEVTADESAQLLERRPEVTPNGFELNFVPGPKQYGALRAAARRRLLDVARALTGVDFDDSTFIVATSGRCEFRNKGLDMYIDAMNDLAYCGSARKVLAFILVPAWVAGPREDLQHQLRHNITSRLSDPVITHNLHNYGDDAVVRYIHEKGFSNDTNSYVAVVYVPCYLNGNDGIINMNYYDILPGLDATVFASYYEPWGYTPLESIAFGVPTVTTSLAGFGRWALTLDENVDFDNAGIVVAQRNDNNYFEAVHTISRSIQRLANATDSYIKKSRKAAMVSAKKAQWTDFISYYNKAYEVARSVRNAEINKLK
ncbi:MAG: glycogen/starch synthase [Muribaculaceae bacterium]|nr:glycogen/starch synthase [Muribaculaceae bacterium]